MTDSNLPARPSSETNVSSPQPGGHGHNPADYDWVPVLRKRRRDGWSPEKQRAFIGALADCGSVVEAARSVGMSDAACYKLRRAPGTEGFAAAWDVALDAASARLADIAFDRAMNGVDDVVLDRDGNHVYTKRKYNDRLLMFLLRAHAPDKYRHGNREAGAMGDGQETVPAHRGQLAVAEALKLLGPEVPAEPEKLMSTQALDDALEVANIMDGNLPGWQHRGATGDEEGSAMPEVTRIIVNKLQISDSKSENGDEGD
ncbi:hypothetical protein MNBD_ALPHA04-619 [hydrothermal vent metagenome]|uniref:Uncharacterized protein n=1 Tax=hydrothermal vent metagenome TaxID=652676 RepID=A0A3B0RRJ8_9ZZZZ